MLDDLMSSGLVFWLFLAVVVVVVHWRQAAATREAHATIRMAIEKGQALDPAVVARLLESTRRRDPRMTGAILVAMGLAFPLLGYFLGLDGIMSAFYPLTGVGIVLLFIGIAQLIVWALNRKPDNGPGRFES